MLKLDYNLTIILFTKMYCVYLFSYFFSVVVFLAEVIEIMIVPKTGIVTDIVTGIETGIATGIATGTETGTEAEIGTEIGTEIETAGEIGIETGRETDPHPGDSLVVLTKKRKRSETGKEEKVTFLHSPDNPWLLFFFVISNKIFDTFDS